MYAFFFKQPTGHIPIWIFMHNRSKLMESCKVQTRGLRHTDHTAATGIFGIAAANKIQSACHCRWSESLGVPPLKE